MRIIIISLIPKQVYFIHNKHWLIKQNIVTIISTILYAYDILDY